MPLASPKPPLPGEAAASAARIQGRADIVAPGRGRILRCGDACGATVFSFAGVARGMYVGPALMCTVAFPRVSTRSLATMVVRRNSPRISCIGTRRGWGTPSHSDRVKHHGERRCPKVTVTLTPRGGSAAQPTQPPPDRHVTHAGPQIVPGTQHQPKPDVRTQRP